MNTKELAIKAHETKVRCAEICVAQGVGHITSALSCAEIMTVLYYSVMHYDRNNPEWPGRDRFVMSKNHGSVITYPILADIGYITEEFLNTFECDGSVLGAHSKICVPSCEFSGGSLGIGLGVACGMAWAAKSEKSDRLVFCLTGDSECQEGSIWESVMFAGFNRLRNLVMIVDRNGEGCTDFIEHTVDIEPLREKMEGFGWEYRELTDGHNINELLKVFSDVRERDSDKPLCIGARTIKGHGVPFLLNKPWLHGQTPSGEEGELLVNLLKEEKYGLE